MATIKDRSYSEEYSGLLSNLYVSFGIAGFCLCTFETMRQIRRRRGNPAKTGDRYGNWLSREGWEFGYLMQARSWSRSKSPRHLSWPLMWIYQALWLVPERELPERVGVDATVHVRYLRMCVYYLLLQCLTTLPVLLPIHILYSPKEIAKTSMLKASLASLIKQESGKRWLWVHMIIIYWLLISWVAGLVWLSWGALRYRRGMIRRELARATHTARHAATLSFPPGTLALANASSSPVGSRLSLRLGSHLEEPKIAVMNYSPDQKPILNEGIRGWRQRTVMVSNIPPDLRHEDSIRAYFEEGLSRYDMTQAALREKRGGKMKIKLGMRKGIRVEMREKGSRTRAAASGKEVAGDEDEEEPLITEVVIIRRLLALEKLRARREDVLKKLELAHIALVKKVMAAVRKGRDRQLRREGSHTGLFAFWWRCRSSYGDDILNDTEEKTDGISSDVDVSDLTKRERVDMLVKALGRFLDETTPKVPEETSGEEREKRRFVPWGPSGRPTSGHGRKRSDGLYEDQSTIWEVLHSLPRELLDPYQPLTHLTSLFRNQNAPLVDYLSAKLNLLTSLIEEQCARPIEDFTASSSAFVTFRSPAVARFVRKKMESHRHRRLACDVTPAPDYRDLEWTRLMKNTYRTEFVRGWVIALGVWAFTVVWVIPISFLVGLTSIANIASIIPALENYMIAHPQMAKIVTSLLPTLLVSILTLLIPLFLFLISKNAETISTKSQIHNVILSRFYRFMVCNVVVFFCIGKSALQSFILSFGTEVLSKNLPEVIASSFPQAAPFYAGWLILQTSLTSFLELMMIGLPWIFYIAIRAAKVPRQRNIGCEPRYWNDYYWKPVHIVSLGIVVLFAILNPLVIPFGLVYFAIAYPVFKSQILHVYQHQYETQGVRPIARFVRYTLDGQILAQVVFLAMSMILREKTLLAFTVIIIILTAVTKILLTRAIKARFYALEIEEAEGLFAISKGRPRPEPVSHRISIDDIEALGDSDDPARSNDCLYTQPSNVPSLDDMHCPPADPNDVAAATPETTRGWITTWRLRSGQAFPARWGYGQPRRSNSLSLSPLRGDTFEPETSSQMTGGNAQRSRFVTVPARLVAPLFERFDRSFGPVNEKEQDDENEEENEEHFPVGTGMKERKASAAAEDEARLGFGGGKLFRVPPLENVQPELDRQDNAIVPLVQPHKGPSPWNDHPDDSRKYSYQPAYMEPMSFALWLPRHPLRTLDLEDTIDLSRSIETSLGGSGRIGAWGLEDDSDNECPEDQKGGDEWRNDEDVEDPHQRAILQKETPAILVDSPDLLDIVAVDDNETKTSNDSGMPGFEIVVRPSSPSPEEQRPVSLVPSPRSPSVSPAKSLASQESITPVRAHTRGPSMRKHPRLQGTERIQLARLMRSSSRSNNDDDEDEDNASSPSSPMRRTRSRWSPAPPVPPSPSRFATADQHQRQPASNSSTIRRARTTTFSGIPPDDPSSSPNRSLAPSVAYTRPERVRPAGGRPRRAATHSMMPSSFTRDRAHSVGTMSSGDQGSSGGGAGGGGLGGSGGGGPPGGIGLFGRRASAAGGRGRSDSVVSARLALQEEVMEEERKQLARDRKEEAETTEREGSALKRGGSRMLRRLGVTG